MSVPLIDFAPFYHGTKVEQAQLAARITHELQKNGAMRLVNHKIPVEMIDECYAWVSCTSFRNFLDHYKCKRKESALLMTISVPTERNFF